MRKSLFLEFNYSYFEDTEVSGETPIIHTWHQKKGSPLVCFLEEGMDNLLKCFERIKDRLGPKPMYGTRVRKPNGELGEFKWKTYDQVYKSATSLAKILGERDFFSEIKDEGKTNKFIGIYCKTREEYMFTWIACWYNSACLVPLYDTLGEESIEWIIHLCELKTVVTVDGNTKKLETMKQNGKLETLNNLIVLDSEALPEGTSLNMLHFQDLLKAGEESKFILNPQITPDSLAMICFTSGTTSLPKGVMLNHRNYVSMANSLKELPFLNFKYGEIHFGWLPLAHVLEQFETVTAMVHGLKTGFYSGEVPKMVDDLVLLKPHYFGTVPRMLVTICEKITNETDKLKGFKKYLFTKATRAKLEKLRKTGNNKHFFYDKLVFKKIRMKFGGNLRLLFTGGAPCPPEVLEKIRIWLSCSVVQGYGQTETTGPVFKQDPDENIPCSVGSPMPHIEAKLIDIPEMNYTVKDVIDGVPTPRGEILMRGHGIATGYFRNPELTKETFRPDGWMHTGDIGKITPTGELILIDRKKHIFKLLQGEYIAPEKLENLYQQSPYVGQIFVTGNSYKTFIVAIIIPASAKVEEFKKEHPDVEDVCSSADFKKEILVDLEKRGRESKFNGLEIIKRIFLTMHPFSIEDGTMTPTQKLIRHKCYAYYEKTIEDLYSES